jgi:hypothetical protein
MKAPLGALALCALMGTLTVSARVVAQQPATAPAAPAPGAAQPGVVAPAPNVVTRSAAAPTTTQITNARETLAARCARAGASDKGVTKACVLREIASVRSACNTKERANRGTKTDEQVQDGMRECMIDELEPDLEMMVDRIYGFREDGLAARIRLPAEFRCSKYDFRTFNLCIRPRYFRPSGRVYFDVGDDSDSEVDIFRDGNLSPSIDFVSLYVPWRFGKPIYYDSWSWGPSLSLGITAAPESSEDSSSEASSAPVVMLSLGMQAEYLFEAGSTFAVELGYAVGFSSDEAFSSSRNRSDGAVYVGIKVSLPDKPKSEGG